MNKELFKQQIRKAIEIEPNKAKIKSIRLFGSFLHGKENKDSDVDLLIEFNVPVGFFTVIDIQNNLEQQVDKKIDLVTPESLSKYFRESVINESELIYG